MINFEEELLKFSPIVSVDNIEETIQSNEIIDIMDIFKEFSKTINKN